LKILLTLTLVLTLISCEKEEPMPEVKLPINPILTVDSHYGVVKSAYLRVFQEPTRQADVVTRLRPGYVVQIVSTTAWREVLDDINAPWHKIEYDTITGWVFGAYVDVYESIYQAEAASREAR